MLTLYLVFVCFLKKTNIFTTFWEEEYWKIGHIFCLRLMSEDSKLHHQWIWLYIIHDGCVTSNLPGMPVVYVYLGKNNDKAVFSRGENFYVLANKKSQKLYEFENFMKELFDYQFGLWYNISYNLFAYVYVVLKLTQLWQKSLKSIFT